MSQSFKYFANFGFCSIVSFLCFFCYSQTEIHQQNDTKEDEPSTKKKNIVIDVNSIEKYETQKIYFETLDYNIIKAQCEKMLSPDGYILNLPERKMIIVHDKPSVIAKIKSLAELADSPAVNIRIDILSSYTASNPDNKLDVDIIYKTPDEKDKIIIEDGKIKKPDSINIEAKKRKQNIVRNNATFLVTMSGKPATLFVGKEIIDPQWLNNYKLVPTVIVTGDSSVVKIPGQTPDLKWKNVGASLKILPTLLDNGLVDVEVYPEISYVDGEGKKQAVKVESVITKVTIKEGQILPLAGLIDKNREFYSNLFGLEFMRKGSGGILDMSIKATVLKPNFSTIT